MIENGFKLEVEALISREISYVTEEYTPERLKAGGWRDRSRHDRHLSPPGAHHRADRGSPQSLRRFPEKGGGRLLGGPFRPRLIQGGPQRCR